MAKKYTKSKLKVFKESIEKRMEEIATDMDDLHDGILDNSNDNSEIENIILNKFIKKFKS